VKNAVLLLSGGIDSATCGAIARSEGYALYAMSFRYGQRHAIELQSAAAVARFLNVKEHRIVDIDLRAFGGSSLTSDMPVPKTAAVASSVSQSQIANRKSHLSPIPSTYVPARNTIFLSFALGWAEVLRSRDIFIGVNAVDYSGYPDCRPEFVSAYQEMANLATKAAVEGSRLTIHTPLIDLTKAQIIRMGVELGLDYGITHSCYDPSPDGAACGWCDSCVIRRKGFAEAGVPDPTRYVQ
jgi:7-cyano-7-deazaguanine synthase